MTDGLLIVIAVATVVTAVVQVGVVVFALRAARQAGETMRRVERDLQPVMANLRSASGDISRAAAAVAAHVERAEQSIADLSRSVDQATSRLGNYARVPFTNAFAVVEALRTAFEVLRDFRRPRKRPQPAKAPPEAVRERNHEHVRDDDMFIG